MTQQEAAALIQELQEALAPFLAQHQLALKLGPPTLSSNTLLSMRVTLMPEGLGPDADLITNYLAHCENYLFQKEWLDQELYLKGRWVRVRGLRLRNRKIILLDVLSGTNWRYKVQEFREAIQASRLPDGKLVSRAISDHDLDKEKVG